MKASEIISPHFLEVNLDDLPHMALELMDQFAVDDLPVMQGDEYLGLINRRNLHRKGEANDFKSVLSFIHTGSEVHLWDVLKTFEISTKTLLPVLTEDGTYLGSIVKKELVNIISALSSVQRDGAIIELVMRPRDYSLSQISQIIEGNDVKVLSLIVNEVENENFVQITIKLNSLKIFGVLQTFGRYGIAVKRVYNFNENTDWLEDRRDALLRFINT